MYIDWCFHVTSVVEEKGVSHASNIECSLSILECMGYAIGHLNSEVEIHAIQGNITTSCCLHRSLLIMFYVYVIGVIKSLVILCPPTEISLCSVQLITAIIRYLISLPSTIFDSSDSNEYDLEVYISKLCLHILYTSDVTCEREAVGMACRAMEVICHADNIPYKADIQLAINKLWDVCNECILQQGTQI